MHTCWKTFNKMWLDKNMYRLLSADFEATQFTDMRQAATNYAYSNPMTFVKSDCVC